MGAQERIACSTSASENEPPMKTNSAAAPNPSLIHAMSASAMGGNLFLFSSSVKNKSKTFPEPEFFLPDQSVKGEQFYCGIEPRFS
jgi:hypothetical protein